MAVGPTYRGWHFDAANARLQLYYNGTEIGRFTATTFDPLVAMSVTGTVTGSTGLTATTGDIQSTAGHFIAPVGNVKIGNPGAFATTQPQGAVVMGGTTLSGVAPVGAIATAAGVFASDTVVRKIIADGTASNVET